MSAYPARRSSGFGSALIALLTLAALAAAAYVAWFGLPSLPTGPLTINGQPRVAAPIRNVAPAISAPAAPPVQGAVEPAPDVAQPVPAGVSDGAGRWINVIPPAPVAPINKDGRGAGELPKEISPAERSPGGAITGAIDAGSGGVSGGVGTMEE